MTRSESIDARSLRELMTAGASPLVVDVREFPEFAAGRIPGSRLIPYRQLAARRSELPTTDPIYLTCQLGRQSARAQRRLRGLGFKNVINVEGGLTAWRAAGLGTEQDAKLPWSLERQVRLTVGVLILTSGFLAAFVDKAFLWLAVFVGAGLAYSGLSNSCGMAMLLARMPWNRQPASGPGSAA